MTTPALDRDRLLRDLRAAVRTVGDPDEAGSAAGSAWRRGWIAGVQTIAGAIEDGEYDVDGGEGQPWRVYVSEE